MTKEQSYTKKPSFFWLMTEVGRAIFEYSTFIPYNLVKKNEELGDGHSVLVLPGFMATDLSTKPLRKFLNKIGYNAHGWEIGRNYANEDYLEILLEKVEELFEKSGDKISIIGWSLGGVFARQLAKKRPHMVRQIITLGSPFRGINLPNNASWMYKFITNGKSAKDIDPLLLEDLPNPAPVPTTAIYSKEDGVVPWQTCMEKQESNIHQNVQVRGSHFGLGVNPSVLEIIADRLKYSEVNWTRFRPETRMQEMMFYPSL
ncbi:MAG: alpha/beta fold hydrolase [Saprospiraceae bacterium]